MNLSFIQLLPLIITFVAGSFALWQIRSNNVTNARIKWLDNFKQIITDFIAEICILQMKDGIITGLEELSASTSMPLPTGAQKYIDNYQGSIQDHLKVIEQKYYLLKLNLNPKEELHTKLEMLLEAHVAIVNRIPLAKNKKEHDQLTREMRPYTDCMTLLTRHIMKLEWEKIKRPLPSRVYYFRFGKGKLLKKEATGLAIETIK